MTSRSRWTEASPRPFWLDTPERPSARPSLEGVEECDLAVIGGGFTGLWAALQALDRDPSRKVVLLDANRVAQGASGRNGGFCAASLTHGDANGRSRWPAEMPTLRRLGAANLAGLRSSIESHEIRCALEPTGQLDLATEPWQVESLREEAGALDAAHVPHRLVEGDELAAEFGSPLALAGLLDEDGQFLLDPARLAWGLACAIEGLGGTVAEHSEVTRLERHGASVELTSRAGILRARQVIVATAAAPALVRRTRGRVVPVYDYVLVSEPLSHVQLEGLSWPRRRGIADTGNRFHYVRLTEDNRILFGGYEAVYRFNQRISPVHDEDPSVFSTLESHFDAMFPSLDQVAFSHRWGGAIDASTRFCASATLSHRGAVATVNGFTGLGVGASRFFASAALDLLDGAETEATTLSMVASTPVPFPPEPLRFLGIEATRRALARADQRGGARGPWLRLLDRLGLGFDS